MLKQTLHFSSNIKQFFGIIFCLCIFFSFNANAESVPAVTDSRIKTIVFNENEVFQLKFHYGFQSFIEFSEDEDIEIISLGEAFPWRVTPVGKRLFIRPLQINVRTNMTIVTTKRTYQFEITASKYDGRADEELIYSVRFYYPDKYKLPSLPKQTEVSGKKGKTEFTLKNEERGSILNFDYSIAGESNEITPLKVFDDSIHSYFQFPDDNLIIPSIHVVDIYGNEIPVNYHLDGKYVVIDTVQLQFSLRLGNNLLCIFNNSVM